MDREVRAGRFHWPCSSRSRRSAQSCIIRRRGNILGVVVGRTHLVRVRVRKLRVHPNLGIADLVERRRDGSADAVTGQLILVAHSFQGRVEGVLADALLEFAAVREQMDLGRPHHTQQVAHDLDGLHGQRHDVGRNVLRALAGLAHLVLGCLTICGGMIHRPRSRSNWSGSPAAARRYARRSGTTAGCRVGSANHEGCRA